ncbi:MULTISPECIES: helix-turn-helix domain-containing protein [unclassified Nocardioides]|uniref:AraC-like ligand-binding domain-containing protein n=1 Tax=unclassified Nocardioides TaxID=2615069 RepID=UPI00070130A4|nr:MULTISPECIES: helix-turn-helix domain-containing protein [unclassified Nocardioides]KRA30011.1 hypothetical protein ASD81_20190 [Nocardioides sp. Root614]KRA86931.1 hypothetical protein ASD84_22405 [Nocardioides sp. Root682]
MSPREGFESWEDRICHTFVPLRARCADDTASFHGDVDSTTLGAVVLADVVASHAQVERTPRLIKADDPELYKFGLQTSGSSIIEQDNRQAHLLPGDLAIYDTSRPYRITFSDDFRMTVAMFPRSLVRLPEQQMAALTAVRLAGDNGLGALVAPLMRGLSAQLSATQPIIATHLGDAVVDLVTAAFAQQLDLPVDPTSSTGHRTLVAQVRKFVDERLRDPDLTPQMVADAHFVSVRYLQKAFETEGTSVSGLIRTRRLDQCRRDLTNPGCGHFSIAQVGHRWGFPDAAHFSRLFRSTYGQSPREFRKTHAA